MTLGSQISASAAEEVIESLRKGIPPKRYVRSYAAGNDAFLDDVRKRHLESTSARGKIRFISGSWGAGKTHFLRLLREEAFDANYLVSTVELNVDETPFNKFDQVFFDIVRNVASPEMYKEGNLGSAAPFAEVLRRALFQAAAAGEDAVTHERFQVAKDALFADDTVDIDFRRVVSQYWETFLAEGADRATLENTRGRLLQWFAGEGTLSSYRQNGIQKIVKRENARLMLQSLSRFATHLGYRGLTILFDEAEMSYSAMRKSNLKQAHNNLLHLINSIDETDGLILVYAATPDFFIDERHGITIYGALAQRIGQPEDRPPLALDRVWNLDAVATSVADYVEAAGKIREIYVAVYPEAEKDEVSQTKLGEIVTELVRSHPEFSHVSTWRVVITGTIEVLDSVAQGRALKPAEQLHDDIMERLRDK